MTDDEKDFVKRVKELCSRNYERGGDIVIETYTDEEIVANFKDLEAVRETCGLRIEQQLNTRWGEDTDPQLEALERFKGWEHL